jgi:hypothetical protein
VPRARRKVYVETTVISYLSAWPSRDLIRAAHQQITRDWWEHRRRHFDLYVSQNVIDEVGRGDPDAAQRRNDLIADVPLLGLTETATRLARELLRKRALPAKAVEDSLHIAISAAHGMDFLLTWNCTHIANAEMMGAIALVIRSFGLEMPLICTPEELMGDRP